MGSLRRDGKDHKRTADDAGISNGGCGGNGIDVFKTFKPENVHKKPKHEQNPETPISLTPSSSIFSSTTTTTDSKLVSLSSSSSSKTAAPCLSHIPPRDLKEELENEKSEDGGGFAETAMVSRLFERPTTRGAFDELNSRLKPVLMERLKELSAMDRTVDVGLEMADSVYVLNLLGSSPSSIDKLAMGGKKAGEGAMLLKRGARLLAQAQELVGSAVADMSKDLVN